MTTDNAQRSVLLIGKSQLVLDQSVAGLRDLGYKAEGTNDFTDITVRFAVKETSSSSADKSPRNAKLSWEKRSAPSTRASSSSKDSPAFRTSS